jgi:hypothetical protein
LFWFGPRPLQSLPKGTPPECQVVPFSQSYVCLLRITLLFLFVFVF